MRHQRRRWPWRIGAGAALGVTLTAALLCEAAGPWSIRGRRTASQPEEAANAVVEKSVRLNHFSTPWPKVFQQLAEESGSALVMHAAPAGRYRRRDMTTYSRTEAVRILNRELEPLGYRLLEQGEHLVVLHVDALRKRYRRPVVSGPSQESRVESRESSATNASPDAAQHPSVPPRLLPGHDRPAPWDHGVVGTPQKIPSAIRTVSHEVTSIERSPVEQSDYVEPSHYVEPSAFKISTQHRAVDVARVLYTAFQSQAQLIDQGPGGLPAFEVYGSPETDVVGRQPGHPLMMGPAPGRARVTVGIDADRNELAIVAANDTAQAIAALVREVDRPDRRAVPSLQLLPQVGQSRPAVHALPTVLNRLAEGWSQQPTREELHRLAMQRLAQARNGQPAAENQPQPPAEDQPPAVAPQPPEEGPILRIDGIKGPVTIQEVPGVGLVVTGNREDVEAVTRIIRELDRVGRGAAPDIHLLMLQHINSEALADLLNNVYTELETVRRGGREDQKSVSIIPVVKPNAVLILAPQGEMEAVLKLAEELDQPVDPQAELHAFPLKHAIAAQVVDTLTGFYEERGGLGTRVAVAADVRSNTVIVQARPRDLQEIAALIRKVDRDGSGAVNRMQVFVLKNAVAEELAEVINSALQSVLNPAQQTGQAVGVQALGGDPTSQQLRQVKSVVLEFLAGEGADELVRSGILADIRVTADTRTNSLIITAPQASMPLMKALIEQLDQPTSTVAEIKVFTLANADATRMVELLETLFEAEAGQEQLGIQVAGAVDVSSSLIPLRFSIDVRTNSIIAVGGADALQVVEAILLRLDESDVRQRKTEVIRLKNSPVADVAAAINDFLQSQRDLAQLDPDLISNIELLEREIIAVPEIVTNSLLISVTPRYYEEIKQLIATLDEAPAQVIIQALLVEVELNNTDEFGVEFGFQDSLLFDRSVVSNLVTLSETMTSPNGVQTTTQNVVSQEATPGFLFNNQQLGNNTAVNPASVGTQGLTNFSLGRINSDLGFGGLVFSASSESVSLLIRALASQRNVHILSRPQIRTLDNQLAQIQVGQQVPIVNGFTQSGTVGAALVPVVEQDDAGIILTVTPRISPDGMIVMETVAEKSQFGDGVPLVTDITTGAVIESPIKDIATALTTVAVPNGQTIVLGGMITKTDETFQRRVPWLGDIPVLGHAFRYDATATRRTELLIFLTPRIIRTDADSELINQIEAERMHFFECDAEEVHGPIFAVPLESTGDMPMQPVQPWQHTSPKPLPAPGIENVPPTPVPPNPMSQDGPTVPGDETQGIRDGYEYEESADSASADPTATGGQPLRVLSGEIPPQQRQAARLGWLRSPFGRR